MIRKLHNSLLALSATTLTLAACLVATRAELGRADSAVGPARVVAAIPAAPAGKPPLRVEHVRAGAGTGAVAEVVPVHRKGKSQRNRQILAMPFFSFATRS